MSELCFRKAKESDLERLTEIYNEAILSGQSTGDMDIFSPEDRRVWFDEHQTQKHFILAATVDGEVIGYSTLSPYRKGRRALEHVSEISIYIDLRYVGRHIGSGLLKEMISLAKQSGTEILVSYIFKTNEKSIRVVKRAGFEKWGELPGVIRQRDFSTDHVIYGLCL